MVMTRCIMVYYSYHVPSPLRKTRYSGHPVKNNSYSLYPVDPAACTMATPELVPIRSAPASNMAKACA